MKAVDFRAAEGLWLLAEDFVEQGSIVQAVKCLEAICQSNARFPPWIEAKSRLKLSRILLEFSDNLKLAQTHLERTLLLLKQVPGEMSLKCSTISLLCHCYSKGSPISIQKQMINRGIHLTEANLNDELSFVWKCNFSLQLASVNFFEGDLLTAMSILKEAKLLCQQRRKTELQLLFAASVLHAQISALMPENETNLSIQECECLLKTLALDQKLDKCFGLLLYVRLLIATCHQQQNSHEKCIELSSEVSRAITERQQQPINSQRSSDQHLTLISLPPLTATWIQPNSVAILADLMCVASLRDKGSVKEAAAKLKHTLDTAKEELKKLGVGAETREDQCLHHFSMPIFILIHFYFLSLEHTIVLSLTITSYKDALTCLSEMVSLVDRFPTTLASNLSNLHSLLGHYLHCMGLFPAAIAQFSKAKDVNPDLESKLMCDIFAAMSCVAIGSPESLSQAVDLLGPVSGVRDSLSQGRTKIGSFLGTGLLKASQGTHSEARMSLANGLRLAHLTRVGGPLLLSQFLLPLGGLSMGTGDLSQARDILRSAVSSARLAGNLPVLLGALRKMIELHGVTGESAALLETQTYFQRKSQQLSEAVRAAMADTEHERILRFAM